CSRRPYSGTPIYDIDHIDRHTDGGPTTAGNGQGLGVGDHHTLDLPDWNVTTTHAGHHVTWTTPKVRAYDITHRTKYLHIAELDEQYIRDYWDDVCGGGV
ncbi:MAG TPA: hypothetical protein VEX15_13385, partial [Nocardioidaceae bacterium]|nr:hypothetical protein [Nocardioidaceae bacterium]